MNVTHNTSESGSIFSSNSFVFPDEKKIEEKDISPVSSVFEPSKIEEKLLENTINDLEDELSKFLKQVKDANEVKSKEPDEIAFAEKIAPLLNRITKYSSKGLKIASKTIDFTQKNLPYEIPERLDKIIEEFFYGVAKKYTTVCKFISAGLYLLEFHTNKKLELILENKKTLLNDLYSIHRSFTKTNLANHKIQELETLNKKIEQIENEVEQLQNALRERFNKWNKKIVPVACSSLVACLKMLKPACSTGLKSYLSFVINTLKVALDIHGIFKEGTKLIHSVKKLFVLREKWFALDEKITFYTNRLTSLKSNETDVTPNNSNVIACERLITILKAKRCFLERVEFPERWKNIGFKFLELLKDATSFLGTVGALFVVTSVLAVFFTNFALWFTLISYLISAGSYVYSLLNSSSKLTPEQISIQKRDDRISEIFKLRAQIKSMKMDGEEISQEKKKEFDEINDKYMQNIREYYDDYKVDLMETKQQDLNAENSSTSTDDGSLTENDSGSFFVKIVSEKKNIFNSHIEQAKRERFMKEIGLDKDSYEDWVTEVMEYMFEREYIEILKKGLGIQLSSSPDKALEQVINYIRV